ncbi:uncharacterized protein LOC106011080 [Aplysia californica]|uniref:Uncharacterized protein LOC106011080 n=1 Tax=Aplysia californica TaxID=6500 RepID=A0ABM0ZUT7_APLCA|nr:uncharacterized protein LOC106011080 [Aplysia californica]
MGLNLVPCGSLGLSKLYPPHCGDSPHTPSVDQAPMSVYNAPALVVNEILECGWDNLVVVTGSGEEDQELASVYTRILTLLQEQWIFVLHFTIVHEATVKDMLTLLREVTAHTADVKNILLLTESAPRLLKVAQNYYCSGHTISLNVCRARVAIVSKLERVSELELQLQNSEFDNIVIFAAGHPQAYTLMWRENRTRQLDTVDTMTSRSTDWDCAILPNLKFGLNQRRLRSLTKEWASELYKVRDPKTGNIYYDGFLIDVLNTLSEVLNFSYVHVPGPALDDSLTWEEYPKVIARGEVDFGATLWPASTVFYFNHSITYNVIFAAFTGAYIYEDSASNQTLGSPFMFIIFSPAVYLLIVASFLWCVFQYIVVTLCESQLEYTDGVTSKDHTCSHGQHGIDTSVSPQIAGNGNETDVEFQRKISIDGDCGESPCSKKTVDILISEKSRPLSRAVCVGKKYSFMVTVAFGFWGAICNQASLRLHRGLSARIIFATWCIAIGVLSAHYNGSLTANLIEKSKPLPFSTFQEMLDRGDVKWGIPYDVSLIRVLRASPHTSILRRVYEGAEFFTEDNSTASESKDALLFKLQSERYFVVITLRYILERMKRKKNPNILLLKDDLMRNDLGFIMPRDSELLDIFNQELSKMTLSGVMDYLRRKWKVRTSGGVQSKCTSNCLTEGGTLKFEDLKGFFFFSALAIIVSVVVLIVENMYVKCKSWRDKSSKQA